MKMMERKKLFQQILLNLMNHSNIIERYEKKLFLIQSILSFQLLSPKPVFNVNRVQ